MRNIKLKTPIPMIPRYLDYLKGTSGTHKVDGNETKIVTSDTQSNWHKAFEVSEKNRLLSRYVYSLLIGHFLAEHEIYCKHYKMHLSVDEDQYSSFVKILTDYGCLNLFTYFMQQVEVNLTSPLCSVKQEGLFSPKLILNEEKLLEEIQNKGLTLALNAETVKALLH